MGEFRIGRSRAQHSYPETRRNTTLQFARNFAAGPGETTDVASGNGITGGTQIPWAIIESVGVVFPPGVVDVPITPRITGIIQITGVVEVKSSAPAIVLVQVQLGVDGGALPAGGRSSVPLLETVTVDAGGEAIPILVDLPAILAIGVTRTIQIVVSDILGAGTVILALESSTLDVQEVPAATG